MVKLNNLSGIISQLTLHGQLAFIQGEIYEVRDTKTKGYGDVAGTYLVVETNEKLDAKIEMLESE